MRRPVDVELVPGGALECVLPIRADLRVDARVAEERERAASDGGGDEVEMQRDLPAAAEVDAACDVEEAGELGEAVAVRFRRDLGELLAEIVRE